MKILAIILDVLCTFNEGFWLYCIIDTVFERREAWKIKGGNKWWVLGSCILCNAILTLALNQITLVSSFTVVILAVVSIILTCLFWKSDILSAIAVIGADFFIMYLTASIEFLAVGMIGGAQLVQKATMEQNGVRALFLLVCGSVWLFLNLLFYRWLKGIHIDKRSTKYTFFISLTGLIGGSFIVGQMPNHFNGSLYIAWCFFLIIFMACVYVSYFMIKKKELQMRIQIMNTQNDMLERNYEQINDFYTANAKLYHDMNHHLDAVYRMLEKDDKEQAKQYIESLREPMKLSSIPLRTGIDMADVILCEMEKKAAVKGISVHMDVQGLLHGIAMEKKDLCALLTNLLDNAVEGAEREIWVQIKPIHRMLIIQIKNDCIKTSSKENGRLKTTKENPALHGWGMQIIEQIVSKYEGSMEYHVEKGVFSVEIMMDVLG